MKQLTKYISIIHLVLFAQNAFAQYTLHFGPINSKINCQYDFKMETSIDINRIKIVDIYSDDGKTGSFAYEVYFDLTNKITSNGAIPPDNYWAFDLTMYSDRNGKFLKNNLIIPIQSNTFYNQKLDNNPSYNGSAKAMGFEKGKEYTAEEILHIFEYDRAQLFINMPCLEVTLQSYILPPTSGNTVLPVKLLGFDVTKNNSDFNVLKWSTNQEKDFSHFEIEKSFDAITWTPVDQIASQNNNNTTANENVYYYEWIDYSNDVNAGSHTFYRLKMVDNDASFNYSKIVKTTSKAATITLYPNPTQNVLNVSGLSQGTAVNVCDIAGNVKMTVDASSNSPMTINVSALNSGVYYLLIQGQNEIYKFVKQ